MLDADRGPVFANNRHRFLPRTGVTFWMMTNAKACAQSADTLAQYRNNDIGTMPTAGHMHQALSGCCWP